jgi:hypothetical protein
MELFGCVVHVYELGDVQYVVMLCGFLVFCIDVLNINYQIQNANAQRRNNIP